MDASADRVVADMVSGDRLRRIAFVLLSVLGAASVAQSSAQVPPAASGDAPGVGASNAPMVLPSDTDWLLSESGRAQLFDRIAHRLEAVYWDPDRVDWDRWRDRHIDDVAQAASRPAFDAAMRRAFDGLDDDHSRWIGRPQIATAVREPSPGPPVDLGVEALPLDGRGLLILRAHPGSAADVAGLQRGDLIVRAGDASLEEQGLGWTMQSRIAAALRSGVADLSVRRGNETVLHVEVVPRVLPSGASQQPSWSIDPASGIARIDLPSFGSGSAEAVHRAAREAEAAGATGLLIDLRGNPGGSVVELGLVLALVTEGTLMESWTDGRADWRLEVEVEREVARSRLVRSTGPYAESEFASARLSDPWRWRGPIGVLIDARSSSAAEAAAAVLVADANAIAVGRATAGNVESVRRISFPGGNEAWVAVGELRFPGGAALAPVDVAYVADLDVVELARGFDAPIAVATRALRGLPVTPGRWF